MACRWVVDGSPLRPARRDGGRPAIGPTLSAPPTSDSVQVRYPVLGYVRLGRWIGGPGNASVMQT
jgi:hypothetical protein